MVKGNEIVGIKEGIFCKENSVCLKGWKGIGLVVRNVKFRRLFCRE